MLWNTAFLDMVFIETVLFGYIKDNWVTEEWTQVKKQIKKPKSIVLDYLQAIALPLFSKVAIQTTSGRPM